MTQRTEDDEIIDTALDTLAWQRREIDRLTAENERLREAYKNANEAWGIAQLEVERLREALVAEREENLWSAYATGDVIGDEWTHLFMSDGEWLAKECGFDPRQGYYSAAAIRNAIPIAARAALGDTQ
jgi:FtsZ-binding cell division protein ZapB